MIGAGKHAPWCVMLNLEPNDVDMVHAVPSDETTGGGDDAVKSFLQKWCRQHVPRWVMVNLEPTFVDTVHAVHTVVLPFRAAEEECR